MQVRGGIAAATLVALAVLSACEPGSGPEVGPADPSTSAPVTSQVPEPSVAPSSEAPAEPTSGPQVSEDPSLPAPVLAEFDETLDVFAGSPPPVVFASLFGGVLPSEYPSELAGLPVKDVKEQATGRSVYYSETMGLSDYYDLTIEVGRLLGYQAMVEADGPLVPVGFASCVPDDTWCAVVADDGLITLSAGVEGLTQEQLVEELGKVIEFYAGQ